MNRINIVHLIVSRTDHLCGADRFILSIFSNSDKTKFNHILFCLVNYKSEVPLLLKEASTLGITTDIVYWKWRFDIKPIFTLRKLLKKYEVDILQCYEYKSNFIGLTSTIFTNVRKVVRIGGWLGFGLTLENFKLNWKAFIYEKIDSYIRRKFDRIIAISQYVQNILIAQKCLPSKISLIFNGIDIRKFAFVNSIDIKKSLNISPEAKIVGTISRLTLEKGHKYLLEAAVEVIKECSNICFIIIGEGPLKDELFNYSQKLGIQDKIYFTGFSKDVVKYLSIMDVFAFPSLWEGFGFSLIEAMAVGVPIVATKVGAIPEIIKDDKTGILVESKNPLQLAKAITKLLLDQKTSKRLKENAKEVVRNKFSVKVMVKKYEDVYVKLVNT